MDCALLLSGYIADKDIELIYAHIKIILHVGSTETSVDQTYQKLV
jgi:hypothetical protein